MIMLLDFLSLMRFIHWTSCLIRLFDHYVARNTNLPFLQVELRDVDTGNKVTERFRTDEAIESMYMNYQSFFFTNFNPLLKTN